jgi:hypothetical protein
MLLTVGGPPQMRRVLTICMNVLVVLAVLLTVHVVVRYFSVLSHSDVGAAFVAVSKRLVPGLGLATPHSLYGGVLDENASLTVIILLMAEWFLSVLRSRA